MVYKKSCIVSFLIKTTKYNGGQHIQSIHRAYIKYIQSIWMSIYREYIRFIQSRKKSGTEQRPTNVYKLVSFQNFPLILLGCDWLQITELVQSASTKRRAVIPRYLYTLVHDNNEIAKRQKQPKCPSIEEWKTQYMYTRELFFSLIMEIMTHDIIWRNLRTLCQVK